MKVFQEAGGRSHQDRVHLLIVGAHGEPRTGTSLKVPDGASLRLSSFSGFFDALPPRMVIYLSVCWGAYPDAIRAVRGKGAEKPTFIAPLVDIHRRDEVRIQNGVIDALLRHRDYEPILVKLVEDSNRQRGKGLMVGMVKADGEWIPKPGVGGLAAPVERRKKYLLVALQMHPPNCQPPVHAVLWDGRCFWQTTLASIERVVDGVNPYRSIGTVIELRAKVRTDPGAADQIGQLDVVSRCRAVPSRSRTLSEYKPPFEHCQEVPKPGRWQRDLGEMDAPASCRACNWAVLTWGIVLETKSERIVKAVCCRSACPTEE